MNEKIVVIAVIVFLIVALPVVVHLGKDPIPLTFDRMKDIYRQANYSVGNEENMSRPGYGASSGLSMTLNGAATRVFLFTETEGIEDSMAVLETDAVKHIPSHMPKDSASCARNGGYVMLVTCEDEELRGRVISLFEGMDNPKQPKSTAAP